MKKKIDCLLVLFLALAFPLNAQGVVYEIAEENYIIDGATTAQALAKHLGSSVGRVFASEAELELYLEEREQAMHNLRVFRNESISVRFENLGSEKEGLKTVRVIVEGKDGWTILPVAVPTYSNNKGFTMMGALVFPNLAGQLVTMANMASVTIPQREGLLLWDRPEFNVGVVFSDIALSRRVRMAAGAFYNKAKSVYTSQGIDVFSADRQEVSGFISIDVPFGRWFLWSGGLSYAQAFDIRNVYDSSSFGQPASQRYNLLPQSSVRFGHTIYFNTYNWQDNFKEGAKISLSNDFDIVKAFKRQKYQTHTQFKAGFEGRQIWGSRLNPSFRAGVTASLSPAPMLNLAEETRGINNGELEGDLAVYLNAALQIKAFDFKRAKKQPAGQESQTDAGKEEKESVLQIHLAPFVDYIAVFAYDRYPGRYDNGFSAGLETIFYLDQLKRVPFVFDIGFDLRSKYSFDNPGKKIKLSFSIAHNL